MYQGTITIWNQTLAKFTADVMETVIYSFRKYHAKSAVSKNLQIENHMCEQACEIMQNSFSYVPYFNQISLFPKLNRESPNVCIRAWVWSAINTCQMRSSWLFKIQKRMLIWKRRRHFYIHCMYNGEIFERFDHLTLNKHIFLW